VVQNEGSGGKEVLTPRRSALNLLGLIATAKVLSLPLAGFIHFTSNMTCPSLAAAQDFSLCVPLHGILSTKTYPSFHGQVVQLCWVTSFDFLICEPVDTGLTNRSAMVVLTGTSNCCCSEKC
jgi:uncharacterized membrane protein